MRGWACVCAIIVLSIPGRLAAAPSASPDQKSGRSGVNLPIEGTVVHPDWVARPGPEEFSNYYPPVPQLIGLGGRTLLQCDVTSAGATENCKVLLETPAGLGFGDASIALGRFFRMKPMSVDGQPVGGAKVTIPIGFQPWVIPTPTPETADPTPVSPGALALARRIASLNYSPARLQVMATQARTQLSTRLASPTLTEQEQAAIDAYLAALASAAAPVEINALTKHYARRFTEQQLAEIDRFFESSAGAAWIDGNVPDVSEQNDRGTRVQIAVQDAARKSFCAKYECSVAPTPPETPPEAK